MLANRLLTSTSRIASVAMTDRAVSTANATAYTFSAKSFGAAAAGRKLLLLITGGSQVRTVSTVTVAGNSAALVSGSRVANTNETVEIWQITLAAGTSGDVVVTWSGAQDYCGIVILRALDAAAAVHAVSGDAANATASTTITIPERGFAVGITMLRSNSDRTFTWTGLTEIATTDEVIETGNASQCAALLASTTLQTNLAVTCAPSGAGVRNPVMSLASFGPA